MNLALYFLLLVALLVANAPFVLAGRWRHSNLKLALYWCVGFLACLALTLAVEQRYVEVQRLNTTIWCFYLLIVFCLYCLFSFPGFVYKFLWR